MVKSQVSTRSPGWTRVSLNVTAVTQGRLQDFLEVLSQLDPKTSRLGTARPAPNSIDWVLSDKSYQDWRSGSDTGILHVFGPAGSGTTVLATHILKLALEARSYRQAAILSYSFDKDDIQARGQRNAFASLSRQLLLARPGLFHHVRPLCDFMLKQKLFNKHILWSLLSSLLIHCTASAVYCIIHAVHECEESLAEVIHALSKIVHASGGFIKMILTSDDIFASGHMQPCPCVSGTCRSITSGGERHTMIAVEALVRENVARMVREKRPWAEFEDIVRTLCKPPTSHLSAMYALALLESSDIRSTEEEIRTKLKELRLVGTESLGRPSDRHDYESWVVSTFRWMRHAVRLLTIAELAVAVAFDEFLSKRGNRTLYDIGQASLPDLEMLAKLIPRDIIGDLTRRAGPLIKVDGNRVVPVHRSLRELLYDEADSGEKPSHPCYSILTTCLEYLKYASLRHGLASYNLEEQSEFENALLNYAVAYWPDHYELVSQEFRGYANKLVDSFLGDESCLSFWTERYGKTERVLFVDLHLHSSPRIQAISLLGHREHLIGAIREAEVIPSTSEKQDQLQDALNQAARFGQLELVRVLLDSGAKSGRALGLAAAGGHRDVVSALLEANPAAITWEEEKSRYTALHHAVCSGDLTTVEILVKRDDVALNAQTSDGASALCLASETGQTPIFSMLIDRDADMNLEDEDGNDALKLAARGGFSEMVRILLDRRIDPNKPGSKGDTAVHLATQIGHPITLKHLVQADADVKCTNREGLTPLHIAAAQGHLEILKMLLGAQQPRSGPISRHLDDNEEKARQRPLVLTYKFPAPPLQQAAMTGRVDIVQALLEDQAGHSMEDCCRAMFVATRYGLFEVTKKLLDHGSITEARDECGETLLHQAVEGRDTNVLEILLKRTSEMTNVNTRNQLGWTALHNAAYIGSLALVKLLLENKADVNARTNDEETPLHFAAREGHRLVAQALLEGMTDIEKKNSKGETPFMLAVERRHVKTVQDLLRSKKGLDFPFHSTAILQQETVLKALLACGNEWDCSKPDEMQSRNTPLHLAVQLELTRAVELLHEAGADLNARNEDDETPLFLAALTGNVEILRLLLASGADVDTPDSSGRTPLYAASLEGHVETVRALLENDPKPDVNYANARGWVPLHAASEEADITKLLLDEGADPRRGTRFSGMIPFARACFTDRRLPVVRCYLEDPANADLPNIPDNGGETAVHRSAVGGSVRVMKELIQHKAKLDVQRKDGSTPLHIAISTVETSIANLLLDKDVDVSKHNEKDGTVLMVAAAAGQVEIADRLHCKSVDVNEICEPYYTALNAAAYFGRLRMIQWLLRHGADPNLAGGRHGSPLSAALEGGSGDVAAIVSELVEGGHANVNYVTKNGVSVLRMAVDQGLTDVVRILVRHGAGTDGEKPARQPVVLEAVQAGQISILDDLLKDPPNLLVRDKFGRSLLSVAIVTRRHRVVEWLLDRADSMDVAINSGDHAGRTPLILCVLKRNANLAKLLSKGPDIDATDCEGKTALAYACILDVKSSVNSLLAAGASPLLPDYRNRGPLYWACRRSSIEVVQKVLQTLRDKTGRDDRYRTECAAAISAAIASNRPSFMEVLLKEKPLSTSHVAGDGWTPFYTAERYGLASMTEMLVAAGFIDQNPSNQLRPKLDNLASAPPVDAGSAGQPRVVDSKLQRNMMGVTQLDLIQPPSSWSTEDKTPCLIVDETMITVGGAYNSVPGWTMQPHWANHIVGTN